MLKVLAKEGKVLSKIVHVGKKKKEVFSITKTGRAEFKAWLSGPTGAETPRNEFLLKLFFVTNQEEMVRLFQERLEKAKQTYEEYRKIESRLESLGDYPLKAIRLKSLRYGITQLTLEMTWLKEGILEYAHR
jgi:DNA-binding PadR family transcriptional regulator